MRNILGHFIWETISSFSFLGEQFWAKKTTTILPNPPVSPSWTVDFTMLIPNMKKLPELIHRMALMNKLWWLTRPICELWIFSEKGNDLLNILVWKIEEAAHKFVFPMKEIKGNVVAQLVIKREILKQSVQLTHPMLLFLSLNWVSRYFFSIFFFDIFFKFYFYELCMSPICHDEIWFFNICFDFFQCACL